MMRFLKRFTTSVLPGRTLVRQLTSIRSSNDLLPEGFTLFPSFFDIREQRLLLAAALRELDAGESKRVRMLQIDYRAKNPVLVDTAPVESLFLPDRCYTFHEGHYDNVIRHYREMRLATWLDPDFRGLIPVLERLRALYPSQHTQTHLLHLASCGEILPHIDNISASGKWILGVSLGSARTLKMESPSAPKSESFDILLPSGSVYLQRDDVRYHWNHAILPSTDREQAKGGQRVSIMIRDVREDEAGKVEHTRSRAEK